MRADLHIPIGAERLSRLMRGFEEPTLDDAGRLLAWIELHQPVEGHDEYEYKAEIKSLKLGADELKAAQNRIAFKFDLACSLLRECNRGVISAALVGRIGKFLAATKD